MIIIRDGLRFTEYEYPKEAEFEADIVGTCSGFFGQNTIYVDAKKKIGSQALGSAIPDGFLFDMSDPENRELYLVEIELESHDFYKHIFPQITKFFAFFRNSERQKELVGKLFSTINADPALKQQFKKYLGDGEIYKFLNDLVDASQNILLVIDGEKPELPEITDTYSDTWGKMVKVLTIRKFTSSGERLFAVEPEFETIEYSYADKPTETETPAVSYSEEFHLEGVGENVKQIYEILKSAIQEADTNAAFLLNPQKYYISLKGSKNVLHFKFRKKKMRLIVMLPEEEIRARIAHHSVKTLSASVQNFYSGKCAAVYLENLDGIDEVVELLRHVMAQNMAKVSNGGATYGTPAEPQLGPEG